jgi:hypothetical protein
MSRPFSRCAFVLCCLSGLVCAAQAEAAASAPLVTAKSPVRVWADQIGYRTDAPKIVVVASNSPLPSRPALSVHDAATHKVIWDLEDNRRTYKPFVEGKKDRESKEYIAHLDLSALKTPGSYYVVVNEGEKAERSYDFRVGDDVYAGPAKAAWRPFYYQRADCEKWAKLAGRWSHGPSFRSPGQATEAREHHWDGKSPHWGPVDPTGTRVADATPRDVTGGWWDGGMNFSKYVGNTTKAHNTLLLGVQLLGERLTDEQLDLPESGNGVPDALDEARYATEFLLRMADETGACFGKAYEKASAAPDRETAAVQLSAPTSGATMNRACALAYAAVVWEERRPGDPFARKCLDEALKSWELLRAKPHPWPADPKDPAKPAATGDWFAMDYEASRALAAACFFRLKGGDEYHAVIKEYLPKLPERSAGEAAEWWPALHVYGSTRGADEALAKQARAGVILGADKAVKQSGFTRGYAAGIRGYYWGSNRQIAECGVNCILAAKWTENERARTRYLDAAQDFVHYLFGRNPIGKCYLTNMKEFGAEDSVMVLHHAWLGPTAAGNPAPPPGFLVGGASGGIKSFSTRPDEESWAYIEPNIDYQAPAAVLIGYFGFGSG